MAIQGTDAVRLERDRFIGFAFANADLLLEVDADLRVVWAGGAMRTLVGIEADQAVGIPISDLLTRLDALQLDAAIRELKAGERRREIDLGLQLPSGRRQPVSCSIYRSLKSQTVRFHLAISVRAETAEGASPRKRDRASGLIEAVEFAEATAGALRAARQAGQPARLTLVQICGEAELGRLLGPQRSEALLAEIGTQLRRHAIVPDGAAKLGDGQFSVTQIDDDEAPGEITKVLTELGQSYDLDPAALQLAQTSVQFNNPSLADDDVESILSYILDRFRNEGSAGMQDGSADDYLRKLTAETLSRVITMRDLIHERRLSLHYQPIVDLVTRSTHHYEVLLRFPDGRSPFADIQFAEQINTIHEVDLAVAQGAIQRLEQAVERQQPLSLAVNMSARSLLNDSFIANFEELAAKLGEDRSNLIVEITESYRLEDLGKAAAVVDQLGRKGHPICLDDFGAGASSLPYLQQLIVGYVKIDGAYVRGLKEQTRERAIIEGVLATCRSLGVKTVAEMVEREDQHKILQDLGVTLGQGWLYGRPAADIPAVSERATTRVPRRLDPAVVGRLLVKKTS